MSLITEKSDTIFDVGDCVYLIKPNFLIYEVTVTEVLKSASGDTITKTNSINGLDNLLVSDYKAVHATAINYDRLVSIFGSESFVFPCNSFQSILNSNNTNNESVNHRVSHHPSGSVTEVTQSPTHAQITIKASTKEERTVLLGRELINVIKTHNQSTKGTNQYE